MIKKKAATKFLIFPSLAILIASCTTISYVPKVSLDLSPKTINKTVQIDRFKDASPAEHKITPFMGLSVTNRESLANELDLEVTNAVVSDFSENRLFKEVGRKIENPDFVIKGEIKEFYGKSQLNAFAKISMITLIAGSMASIFAKELWIFYLSYAPMFSWYFGAPVSKNTSEIVIEMRLYDNNNDKLINTYTGKGTVLNSSSIYDNKIFAIPTMTNKAFSRAIMQIRDQILADMDKLD